MRSVVVFIESYINQEYRALLHLRTELDTTLIESDLGALNSFFQGLDSGLNLSSSRKIESQESVLRQLQKRVLFQIKEYIHPTIGSIYRVYLSSFFAGDRDYFNNFLIKDTNKGLKIISQYNLCTSCNGKGTLIDLVCYECHGFGWKWRGGEQFDTLGQLVTVQQFTSPADIDHLQEYESCRP